MSPEPRANAGAGRYVAPAAFLLAVTIAVLLIRAGLGGGGATTTATDRPPAAHTATAGRGQGSKPRARTTPARRYYRVGSGDTFGSIAAKTGVSVSRIEELNPGVSSNSLRVGQKLRVK